MQIQQSFAEHEGTKDAGKGRLYLVGTPIGNLEDMTYRAIRTLREADWIAAEDTRQTRKLLAHFAIPGKLISYHEHNKREKGRELVDKLLAGQSVALVSDAGMPAISDPGEDLVKEALAHDIAVIAIPGASAGLAALIVSGLPAAQFSFAGFLPREKKKLQRSLKKLNAAGGTVIVYESPHRLVQTLQAMLAAWGDRRIAAVRELTKKHEEILRGTIAECLEHVRSVPPRGEYCLIVDLAEGEAATPAMEQWWHGQSISQHVEHYLRECGDKKEAMRRVAADRGISRREVYRHLLSEQ
ncbi:MAG TPA: 16S rRNA (cytidine(1402)-2'-O)-methyltransferase [Bacilli bacterium]